MIEGGGSAGQVLRGTVQISASYVIVSNEQGTPATGLSQYHKIFKYYFNVSACIRYKALMHRDRSVRVYSYRWSCNLQGHAKAKLRGWMGPCPTSKMKSRQDVDGERREKREERRECLFLVDRTIVLFLPSEPVHCPTQIIQASQCVCGACA